MKINHESKTLIKVIGYDNQTEYEAEALKIFDKIRKEEALSDEDLAFIVVQLVGAYNGYNITVLPILSSIYGLKSQAFKDISQLEFSYQLEALLKFASDDDKAFMAYQYLYLMVDDASLE